MYLNSFKVGTLVVKELPKVISGIIVSMVPSTNRKIKQARMVYSSLLRHSNRHIIFDTGNTFSNALKGPQTPRTYI